MNVTLPLFGTLSAEPSSHDIEQVAVVKGGADATDFNRSAGISVNTVSRSGTNAFHGGLSYQIQPESTVATRETTSASVFEEDKSWAVANIGGPIVKDRLFFYASYYRPTSTRQNRANLYGEVPDYKSTRDEFFGKLTYSPTASILLNGSYRTSDRDGQAHQRGGRGHGRLDQQRLRRRSRRSRSSRAPGSSTTGATRRSSSPTSGTRTRAGRTTCSASCRRSTAASTSTPRRSTRWGS